MAQKQPKNFVKESGNKTRLKAGRKDAFGKIHLHHNLRVYLDTDMD